LVRDAAIEDDVAKLLRRRPKMPWLRFSGYLAEAAKRRHRNSIQTDFVIQT
jgi:hypothetical protein